MESGADNQRTHIHFFIAALFDAWGKKLVLYGKRRVTCKKGGYDTMKKLFLFSLSMVVLCAAFGTAFAIHEEIPAETQPSQQPSVLFPATVQAPQDAYRLQALINLLEEKGIITRDALNEEIRSLKAGSVKPR